MTAARRFIPGLIYTLPSLTPTPLYLYLPLEVRTGEHILLHFSRPSLRTWTNLVQQTRKILFILSTKLPSYHRVSPIPFATMTTAFFIHERPPIRSVQQCSPNNPMVIPDIMSFVSLEPDAVRLKIEEIKHNIQDATYDYLIKIPTPNTNLLNTADDTIKYIKAS